MIGPRTAIVGIAGALGLAFLVTLAVSQQGRLDAYARCEASIEPDAKLGSDPRKLCSPIVAARWARAVQADTCDAALTAKPENRYGVANNCSSPVKALQAQRDAAAAERDGALLEAAQLRTGQAAAIRRAESDARTQAERKARAAAIVQSAPRNAAGLVVCDARCLRGRSQAQPEQR